AYQCDLTSYFCTQLPKDDLALLVSAEKAKAEEGSDGAERRRGRARQRPSPDGRWVAFVKDHNAWVRSKAEGKEVPLSTTGTAARPFGEFQWSPDGKRLIGYRIETVPIQPVYMVESSPTEGFRGKLHQHEYAQPGDRFSTYEMWVFDPESPAATRAQV